MMGDSLVVMGRGHLCAANILEAPLRSHMDHAT